MLEANAKSGTQGKQLFLILISEFFCASAVHLQVSKKKNEIFMQHVIQLSSSLQFNDANPHLPAPPLPGNMSFPATRLRQSQNCCLAFPHVEISFCTKSYLGATFWGIQRHHHFRFLASIGATWWAKAAKCLMQWSALDHKSIRCQHALQ